MSFGLLEVSDPGWDALVRSTAADVFYLPQYCRFRLAGSSDRPVLLRYSDALGTVFDVTTIRDVSVLPFYRAAPRDAVPAHPIDLASPEYNGPIASCAEADRNELLRRYSDAVAGWGRDSGLVTEFVRLHPGGFDQPNAITVGEIVWVELRQGYEAARRGYRKGHAAAIKKAVRDGAVVRLLENPDAEAVDRLARLYASTMERNHAAARYRHGPEFFELLFRALAGRIVLVEAWIGDAIAASGVFLLGARDVWYLYAGTDEQLRATGANNLKIDRAIEWAAARGYQRLFLGGGFAAGDGLFLTKRGYSHETLPVRHLRRVHDPAALQRLLDAKAAYDLERGKPTRTDYFPSYWLD